MRKRTKFIYVFALMILLASCRKGKEYHTDSGFKYRLYTSHNGKKPQPGDYVTIELVYKTSSDSVLFDSRKNEVPMRFKLERIPFQGSYEEGLTYLSVGDSATFYVPSDSLYEYYFKKKGIDIPQSSTAFRAGTFSVFDVKLLNVQDYVEAEQEQMLLLSAEEKKERVLINKFLDGKDFRQGEDSVFYYYKPIRKGNGTEVKKGKFITVQYTAKFLDGKVFEYAGSGSRPYTFIAGANDVIPAWEAAISKMKAGDRYELLVPSRYAYGTAGKLNPSTGNYIVPPNTPVNYDLEIISVADTLRLSKN